MSNSDIEALSWHGGVFTQLDALKNLSIPLQQAGCLSPIVTMLFEFLPTIIIGKNQEKLRGLYAHLRGGIVYLDQ